jgi:hypothetical protein
MIYVIDTEFQELPETRQVLPISIGIVAEDGRTFYAEFSDFDHSLANDWVKENVLSKLRGVGGPLVGDTEEIRDALIEFFRYDKKPIFWGYFADYDWVVFCQTFGTMITMPARFPQMCYDIRQYQNELAKTVNCLNSDMDLSELPEHAGIKHYALDDAKWEMDRLLYLIKRRNELLDAHAVTRPSTIAKCDHCSKTSDYSYHYCVDCYENHKN